MNEDGSTRTCSGTADDSADATDAPVCPADVQQCSDGSTVSRDPAKDCAFPECPGSVVCPADTQECSDGSSVSRDPAKDCAFPACPGSVDIKESDYTLVGNYYCLNTKCLGDCRADSLGECIAMALNEPDCLDNGKYVLIGAGSTSFCGR